MSASPPNVNVESIDDINELKDLYRKLAQSNGNLKTVIADHRQSLQTIEFKHRESTDQIKMLENQKTQIQKELEQSKIKRQVLADRDDLGYDNDSYDSEDNSDAEPRADKPNTIAYYKEEIEELQLALAEERMLGMQLDFTNRQSAHRADTLQYQLAEEKLKNMHLQSSNQQLQLGDSNSSGFVHLRDSNDNDKDVTNNELIDSNNDENNRNRQNNDTSNDKHSKRSKHKKKSKHKSNNDDDDSTSDLSREFDLKIEEDPGDKEVNVEQEAHDLRHKLLEEQFKTEELKHRHRKSELQLMEYKEELDDLRTRHDRDANGNYLDPESAALVEKSPSPGKDGLSQEDRLKYESQISTLQNQLDIAKRKTQHLDKQRRDSLNIMSKNFFAKQLKAARDTHSLEENLQTEIDVLKGDIYDITKSKILLLQSANGTIDQLREHIVDLSMRLRKYENWDDTSNGNSDENGYDVTSVTDL